VVGDAVLEHVAPRIGEGPEHGGHVGADGLAFRTRRAFAGAAGELRAHGRILDLGGGDGTDTWVRHLWFSAFSYAPTTRRIRFIHHTPQARSHVAAGPHRDQPRSRIVDRVWPGQTAASGRARVTAARSRVAQARCTARTGEGFLTIVT